MNEKMEISMCPMMEPRMLDCLWDATRTNSIVPFRRSPRISHPKCFPELACMHTAGLYASTTAEVACGKSVFAGVLRTLHDADHLGIRPNGVTTTWKFVMGEALGQARASPRVCCATAGGARVQALVARWCTTL